MNMGLFELLRKDRLHHAYLIEAKKEEGLAMLHELLAKLGIATRGNPDFHEYAVDAFLLEHAQLIRHEQSFYGAEGAKKIFLVAFNTMLTEAQNALLKTLEEPTEDTHFFFVTETREQLLPTFLSRVQVVTLDDAPVTEIPRSGLGETALRPDLGITKEGIGEKFLAAPISERLKMIEPMTKAKTDDKPKAKEEARVFLESLERALYRVQGTALTADNTRSGLGETALRPDLVLFGDISPALENVILAKRHLSGRSPSLKLLLEHLALTVPVLGNKP